MKQTAIAALSERVKAGFRAAVLGVFQKKQRLMEKYLLGLLLGDTMFFALARVSEVPFELLEPAWIQHSRI